MRHDFNTIHLLHSIREIPPSVLNSHEKYVLTILLSCMNDANETWYTQDSIAYFCSMSERRCRLHIHSLAQKRFIIIEKPATYARSRTNHYHLNVDLIMGYHLGKSGDKMSPVYDRTGDKTSENGGQNVRSTGDKTSYKERNRRKKEEGGEPVFGETGRPLFKAGMEWLRDIPLKSKGPSGKAKETLDRILGRKPIPSSSI